MTQTTKIELTIKTRDGQQHVEERVISNQVLDDAFMLVNYERMQVQADPNVVGIVEISISSSSKN